MQLQAYMEEARIDAVEMLDRLRLAVSELDLEFKLDVSTVYRHARGTRFPTHDLQRAYMKATSDLVRPEDWFALKENKGLGIPAKKRRRLEKAAAA